MTLIEQFVAALKAHLTLKREYAKPGDAPYPMFDILTTCEHGNTESGFYDLDEIDFDKLLAEIDKFAASFEVKP